MSTRDEIQPLLSEVAHAILDNPATHGDSDYAKGAQEFAGMLICWDRLWPESDPVGAEWLAARDRRIKAEALREAADCLERVRASLSWQTSPENDWDLGFADCRGSDITRLREEAERIEAGQ